ncbi:MAG: T9SS type A sorting domain-containing protein [Fibrobacter sp.]|nr:T9SS type A sorting domain-containing protein [Fibrobacter sp.]
MNKKSLLGLVAGFGLLSSFAQAEISISVDATAGVKKISPYLYGKNIDKVSADSARISEEDRASIDLMNEAGVRFIRANYGNNSTRYNWRKKMTVHPDWYNNVNPVDWDITAKKIQDEMPGTDAMYAFQLTGYAASTNKYNFPDWDFYINHDNKWAQATLDLAGGGEVADDGKTLIKAGDYSLYNEPWPADSTVGIIGHWKDELQYDMKRFQYWSMDNEMEIWAGTHSDLQLDVTGDFLVERYVDVAKKARAAWPDIKLTGPVVANEWYWCSIAYKGGTSGRIKKDASGEERDYCWLEYFIKKVAAEQKASGKRLLDVLDIHWYPSEENYADQVQWHRVFFDTSYVYPGANSIKQVNGGWDEKITREFIFKRINDWLDQYFGEGHGITLGLTETDLGGSGDAMTTAIIYASWLGTFMDNGVEIFTPWSWREGMYEVLHLFSRYGHENRVQSVSSNDSIVSAYTSVNPSMDSMTVILVNRSEKETQQISLDVKGLKNVNAGVTTLTLAGLSGETFESHKVNALKSGASSIAEGKVSIELPAKSITAVLLGAEAQTGLSKSPRIAASGKIFGQGNLWFVDNSFGNVESVKIISALGKVVVNLENLARGNVSLQTDRLPRGSYIVRTQSTGGVANHRIAVK